MNKIAFTAKKGAYKGIQANLSQARNLDSCEHDLWLSLWSFNTTQVSEV